MSGMFPLPGAPRQQQMDPSRLQAFMNQPSGGATNTALKPSNARQSKRLFVHNLPASVTEDVLLQFFNLQLNNLNVIKSSDPCIQANIAEDRTFALVEFKQASDATVALAMDGITMEEHHTEMNGNGTASPKGLEIRRPKDYIVPSADDDAYTEGEVSTEVPDTSNKLAITNLPPFLTDDQVIELLKAFGELRAFVLVRDNDAQDSRVRSCRKEVQSFAKPRLLGNCFLRVYRPSSHECCPRGFERHGSSRQRDQGDPREHRIHASRWA